MSLNRFSFSWYARIILLILVAYIIRPFRLLLTKQSKPIIILFGHLLDGNLKALFDYSRENQHTAYDIYYFTMDTRVYTKLIDEYKFGILGAYQFKHIQKVVDAKCIVTSHGPMILYLLHFLRPKIDFIDVWHGVAFKDYRPIELKDMQFYSAYFAPSESFKKVYVKYRGYEQDRVYSTGMAKHDTLFNSIGEKDDIALELGLRDFKKIILYAPTHWGGISGNIANEVPFGFKKENYLNSLNEFAKNNNYVMIFRLHQNSKMVIKNNNFSNIRFISQFEYPETNRLLLCADLLITDWSSIASDYSAIDRPIIYLDVPPPITYNKSGFPLPMERGGVIVNNFESLLKNIDQSLSMNNYVIPQSQILMKDFVFGQSFDGHSAERCIDQMIRLVSNN